MRPTHQIRDHFYADTIPSIAVSIRDAARISGLSRSAIYLRIGEGRIDARKSGCRTLIMIDSLKRYIESLPQVSSTGKKAAQDAPWWRVPWHARRACGIRDQSAPGTPDERNRSEHEMYRICATKPQHIWGYCRLVYYMLCHWSYTIEYFHVLKRRPMASMQYANRRLIPRRSAFVSRIANKFILACNTGNDVSLNWLLLTQDDGRRKLARELGGGMPTHTNWWIWKTAGYQRDRPSTIPMFLQLRLAYRHGQG